MNYNVIRVPIHKDWNYIVVTTFPKLPRLVYHYYLRDTSTYNPKVDRGVWRLKTWKNG